MKNRNIMAVIVILFFANIFKSIEKRVFVSLKSVCLVKSFQMSVR